MTFITELQSKLLNHQPGLDFLWASGKCKLYHPTKLCISETLLKAEHHACLSWGLAQHHKKGASSLQVSFTLCPPDVTATQPQTSPCSKARTLGSRLWSHKRRWGGHHESSPEAVKDKTRFSPRACWAYLVSAALSSACSTAADRYRAVLKHNLRSSGLLMQKSWQKMHSSFVSGKTARLTRAGEKAPSTQQAETVKAKTFSIHIHTKIK